MSGEWVTMSTECLECGKTWVAVFSVNTELLLECPACGARAGFNYVEDDANPASGSMEEHGE